MTRRRRWRERRNRHVVAHRDDLVWQAVIHNPDGTRWESALTATRWGARRAARRHIRDVLT